MKATHFRVAFIVPAFLSLQGAAGNSPWNALRRMMVNQTRAVWQAA
jgi:hypothetical protein